MTEETSSPSRLSEKLPWLALGAATLAADLWSKHLVFYPDAIRPGFDEARIVRRVCTGWNTVLAYNPGATFGLGAALESWVLALGVTAVIAMLLRSLWKTPRTETAKLFAFSIIVGGAVGNLYDRALRPFVELDRHKGVRDFIDWYVPGDTWLARWLETHRLPWQDPPEHFGTHWYTFNVADAFIVSGVVLLAWKILREKPAAAPAAGAAA